MSTAIATVEKNAGDFLKNFQITLPTYAVKEYRQEVFVKSAMIAIMGSDDLQECLTTKEGTISLTNAMRAAAGTGLSLNPLEGRSALIAYNKKVNNKWIKTAQYQVMAKGLVELAQDSGKVDMITTDTVRENDVFEIMKSQKGDEYKFAPARKNRGEIDGFFASILLTCGTTHIKYMAIEEILEHREKYAKNLTDSNGKEQANHAWIKSMEGMAIKTVLKRLLRHLHISDDVDRAIGGDDFKTAEIDVTPAPALKGTSPDDLAEKLRGKSDKQKKQDTTEATDAEIMPDSKDNANEEEPQLPLGGDSVI